MIQNKVGILFYGKNVIHFTPKDHDLSLPDDELFEVALHDAAMNCNTYGGRPVFKEAMSQNGRVCRNHMGRVYICGQGWSVDFKTDEYIAEFKRLSEVHDWAKFAALAQFDSSSHYNTLGEPHLREPK